MGYGVDFPLSRLRKAVILWIIRVYVLREVWVKRVSTVDSEPVERNARGPSLWGERSVKRGTLSSGAECKFRYWISAWERPFVPILVRIARINK